MTGVYVGADPAVPQEGSCAVPQGPAAGLVRGGEPKGARRRYPTRFNPVRCGTKPIRSPHTIQDYIPNRLIASIIDLHIDRYACVFFCRRLPCSERTLRRLSILCHSSSVAVISVVNEAPQRATPPPPPPTLVRAASSAPLSPPWTDCSYFDRHLRPIDDRLTDRSDRSTALFAHWLRTDGRANELI